MTDIKIIAVPSSDSSQSNLVVFNTDEETLHNMRSDFQLAKKFNPSITEIRQSHFDVLFYSDISVDEVVELLPEQHQRDSASAGLANSGYFIWPNYVELDLSDHTSDKVDCTELSCEGESITVVGRYSDDEEVRGPTLEFDDDPTVFPRIGLEPEPWVLNLNDSTGAPWGTFLILNGSQEQVKANISVIIADYEALGNDAWDVDNLMELVKLKGYQNIPLKVVGLKLP